MTSTGDRCLWLDELRGLAALLVMVGHFRVLLPSPLAELPLFDVFPRGVQLFYMLSGYVMYWLYARSILLPGRYAGFLVKRYFRIAPMFYVAILLCAMIDRPSYGPANLALHALILPFGFHPDYVNGIVGVEWSIFVEFWFYMLFPLLVWLYRRIGWGLLLLAVAVSAGQTVLVYASGADIPLRTFFYNQPTAQLCFFVLGMVLADHRDAVPRHVAIWAGGLSLLLLALLPFALRPFTVQWAASFLLFGGLILGWEHLPLPALLRQALAYLGTISYSLYLLHAPMERWAHQLGLQPGLLGFCILLASAIAAAHLAQRLVEAPGMLLGRRVAPAPA